MGVATFVSGGVAVGTVVVRLVGHTTCATPAARRLGAQRLRGVGEAWPIEAIGSKLAFDSRTNVFFPDKAANYWMTPIWIDADTTIIVEGDWPAVRYFSFQTYTARDRFSTTIGGIRDTEIRRSDAGGYQLTIVPTAADVRSGSHNTIAGLAAGRRRGVSWLTFRTYVSADPNRPAGGVALPSITIRRSGTETRLKLSGNPEPEGGGGLPSERETSGSVPDRIRRRTLKWSRPGGNQTPIPNIDAAYLAALVAYRPGEIVVVRGLAPSFPNAETAADDADVQYWSLCKFGLPSTKTNSCGSDFEVPLDSKGRYTFVISDPRDRPANATETEDVAWLPWGPEPLGSVGLRNIAPSPRFFPTSIQAIGPGDRARNIMGEYLPEITQCPASVFEAGGADACFLRNASPDPR